MRNTHTWAALELSRSAYDEIHAKLMAAGYRDCFEVGNMENGPIDMYGIAVIPERAKCLCVVGCSANGECPIHGDRGHLPSVEEVLHGKR